VPNGTFVSRVIAILKFKKITVTFNLTDIIFFLGISQGLFLSLSLFLIHNRNKPANRILSYLLLISALMLFGRIVIFRVPVDWVWRFGVLADTTIFLFGPFIYMYARRLVFNENPPFRLRWFHFLPAALHLCYYFWALGFPIVQFNEMYFSGKMNLMFFIVEATGLLSFLYYWILTFLITRRYAKLEEKTLSFRQSVLTYLRFLLLILGVFIVLWMVSFLSTYFLLRPFKYINYTIMWISTPFFIYIIGYFSFRQPDIFKIPLIPKAKPDSERLKPDEIHKLQKRLHYFTTEERIYLQPDITLQELARKMGTTPNNLSWLLNQVHQSTFYDYINQYRIEEFLAKIDKNLHAKQTLLALAMDSGFNSKSTFNRVFKIATGTTPSQYIKTKNVA